MTIKNWDDCRKYLPRLWADIYMFCIYIIEYKANEHIIPYRRIGDRIVVLIQIVLFEMMKILLKNLEFTFYQIIATYSAMKFYSLSVQNDIV